MDQRKTKIRKKRSKRDTIPLKSIELVGGLLTNENGLAGLQGVNRVKRKIPSKIISS